MSFQSILYVAFGGAFGSVCRYVMMSLVNRHHTGDFPFHTFLVNILGGFLMGAWIAYMETWLPDRSRDLHLLFAVGILGGFTTFSAFTVDAYLLLERGLMTQAMLYILGSVFLSLAGLMAGMWCVKFLAA